MTHTNRNERGSALLMAVFVIALLGSIGVALLYLTQSEVRMSRADLRGKRAFYLAEAGLEDARRSLFLANGSQFDFFTGNLNDAAGANTALNFDLDSLRATYDADGVFTGFAGVGDDVPFVAANATTAFDDGFYAAFLTNDPIEGITNTTDANRRVMLTAIGAGPDRSVEVVQAILRPATPLPPMPPAAITLLGPQPIFDSGTSNASAYDGNDCGDPAATLHVPTVGATGDSEEEDVEDGRENNPDFTSGGYTDDDTIVNLLDPTDPLLASSGLGVLDSDWNDCQNVLDLIETMRAEADVYCNSRVASCPFPTSMAIDDVIFWDGDLDLGPGDAGQGILIITGSFEMSGQVPWDGVILAIGEGDILRNGNGSGYISGAVIVADVAGPDGILYNTDDCSTGFGRAEYEINGGGNGDINFCTTNIAASNPLEFYKITEFVQR